MPEYLSPGVYVEEIEIGARPIEGVSTSTAGFLGPALRGPENARLITGFEQFRRLYGGFVPVDESMLPFAVDGFFKNGGQRCFIARIAAGDADAMTANLGAPIRLTAIGPGTWGNRIAAKVENGSLQDPAQPLTRFKLTLMYWDVAPPTPIVDPTDPGSLTDPNRREPTLLEVYDNLSADPTSLDYYEGRITANSSLVIAEEIAAGPPALLALTMLATLGTPGGDGTALTVTDYQGRELPALPDGTVNRSGLAGFEAIDEISIVSAPDHHEVANLTTELITHCARMGDRFAVLHSNPATDTLANINNIRPPQDTNNAAFYFPWIKVFNPLINQDSLIPPSGHIAGIYAKTDVERGVFKAPANEVVVGARSLQFQITKGEQDLLNPRGVNCIRAFPAGGIRLWGARTASQNTLWKYVSVRRYILFLKESIDQGTQYVVFEPNSERLWARVKQTIEQFLLGQFRSGALMGVKPEEGFFVKVDRTTMTQDDIDNGRLICIIGVAVVKPAEFVIFRIAQVASGAQAAAV
jgi:uncharacterized protein